MQEAQKQCVFAMYDIRGKQDFIYRSSHIKEIIGGSALIRDCFDWLYEEAMQLEGKGIFHEAVPFRAETFQKHLEEGYLGELVYDGGGNFLLLFKDAKTCRDVTWRFSKRVIQETCTLRVLCSYIENVNFADYKGDTARLYARHRIRESQESTIHPCASLPIVQVDARTSMPLTAEVMVQKGQPAKKVSVESRAKYEKFWQETAKQPDDNGEFILDRLVTKRDEESLLAVIYIDGNNMGAKVSACCRGSSYDECVEELRKFSADIQKTYIDDRLKEIDEFLKQKYGDQSERIKRRFVVYAGDEISFICNARDALDIIRIYLEHLPAGASSCAGAAIFHSHASYARAYEIAEACCENAKDVMKERNLQNASLVDFHYCQGGIGSSLESIREEETGGVISKPWLVTFDEKEKKKTEGLVTVQMVERMKKFLNQLGRSNVKGLAEHARYSAVDLRLELSRIEAHMEKEKRAETDFGYVKAMDNQELCGLVYDMVIMYDLWFGSPDNVR